jgi:hypothetical protein
MFYLSWFLGGVDEACMGEHCRRWGIGFGTAHGKGVVCNTSQAHKGSEQSHHRSNQKGYRFI